MKRWMLLLALTAVAGAHDFWLKPGPRRAVLIYGHEGQEERYSAAVVKKVVGLNAAGESVKVLVTQENGRSVVSSQADVAEFGAEIDMGYWSKTVGGWTPRSKREEPKALISEWSLYYSKVLLQPGAGLNRSLGHRLEFVPLAVSQRSARLKLTLNGDPVKHKAVYSQHEKLGNTDEAGVIEIPREGLTVVSASEKLPLQGNADADRMHLRAVLTLP